MSVMELGIEAVERGLVPDPMTRIAIRRLCRMRIRESRRALNGPLVTSRSVFLDSMRKGPIAPVPEKAN